MVVAAVPDRKSYVEFYGGPQNLVSDWSSVGSSQRKYKDSEYIFPFSIKK